VCRLRDNSALRFCKSGHSPTPTGCGILSDQIVRFASGKTDAQPDHEIRFVCIRTTPHTSRGKYGVVRRAGSDGVLRIAPTCSTFRWKSSV